MIHYQECIRPYTAKLSSGKTFVVVCKIHYSLENFHGASGRDHHVLYTASDSRGKFSQSAENSRKPQKFCHVATVSTIKCILFVRDNY